MSRNNHPYQVFQADRGDWSSSTFPKINEVVFFSKSKLFQNQKQKEYISSILITKPNEHEGDSFTSGLAQVWDAAGKWLKQALSYSVVHNVQLLFAVTLGIVSYLPEEYDKTISTAPCSERIRWGALAVGKVESWKVFCGVGN